MRPNHRASAKVALWLPCLSSRETFKPFALWKHTMGHTHRQRCSLGLRQRCSLGLTALCHRCSLGLTVSWCSFESVKDDGYFLTQSTTNVMGSYRIGCSKNPDAQLTTFVMEFPSSSDLLP